MPAISKMCCATSPASECGLVSLHAGCLAPLLMVLWKQNIQVAAKPQMNSKRRKSAALPAGWPTLMRYLCACLCFTLQAAG
jgi:hypothetical protein